MVDRNVDIQRHQLWRVSLCRPRVGSSKDRVGGRGRRGSVVILCRGDEGGEGGKGEKGEKGKKGMWLNG